MKIHCLLDANSIIKHYVNLPGSDIINYLFDRSPAAVINISNVQIAEVVSLFYRFQREGIISSDKEREEFKDTFFNDIRVSKVTRYAFVDEHLLDFDVYDKITSTPPPVKKPILTFISKFGGFVKELKDIADTGDAIMLMIMREINFIADGNCYLVTCDGHVLKIAETLKLKVINPENTKINNIPQCLDIRKYRRINSPVLKVICKDCVTKEPLCSTSTLDVCEGGICVRRHSNFTDGRSIEIKLSPISRDNPTVELRGQVIRSNNWSNVIRFVEPMSSDLYSSITNN